MSDQQTGSFLDMWRQLPSDWREWDTDTLQRARELDRPILLSIGFPTSQWCQKMIDEVFSHPDVIGLIDTSFMPVVVDRDLRPDLDAIYMTAMTATAGRGGWPLNAVLDHHGRPFWLGTYLTADQLVTTLDALADAWDGDRSQIDKAAATLADGVLAATTTTPLKDVPPLDSVNEGLVKVASTFDPEWGGFGREPKFPSPPHLQLMLRAAMATGGEQVKQIVETTADAMSAGGIYDQIGGGFHRYTTDREWLLARFEKTLFDQAQLIACYHESFTLWGSQLHRRVTEETIHYAITTLQRDDGGFVGGQVGESIGPSGALTEGAYYTWTPAEIRGILSSARVGDEPVDPEIVLDWYDITDEGHVDGRSIPNRRHHRDDQLRSPELSAIRGGLYEVRKRRPAPVTDDTVVTEHHAMMIRSLCGAANYFRRAEWRAAAVTAGEFMMSQLRGEQGWYRAWRGQGLGAATSGDYAAMIAATLRLAESTGEVRWIEHAAEVADYLLDHFFDPVDGALWTSEEEDDGLFVRHKPIDDRAVPSANAVAVESLIKLASVTGEMRYKHQAERILQYLGGALGERALTMPATMSSAEIFHRGLLQIVIVPEDEAEPDWGPEETTETGRLIRLLHSLWRPNFVAWWGRGLEGPLTEGRTEPGAYVCRDFDTVTVAHTAEDLYRALTGRDLPEGQALAV